MRAAYLHGFGDLRVVEVPDPVPAAHEVVVGVGCVQPSVTEAMLISGEQVAMHDRLAARLAAGPVAFGGHEFAGTVLAIGSQVTRVRVGERVTAVETITCGACLACRSGVQSACVRPDVVGFTRAGAFAEQLLLPAANLVRIPDGVTASAAAAIQPLAGALHAHAVAAVRPGESMLVLGAGVMGLLAVQVARRGNAGLIVVAGRSSAKLELASRFGADVVLTAADDVVDRALELTSGVGVDVVVETAGGARSAGLAGSDTMHIAARAVARGGRIVVVSVLPDDARLPLGILRERAVTMHHPPSGAGGYSASSSVFEHALRLVAKGSVNLDSLITHRLEGIDQLPTAVKMTQNKQLHGAINPPQVSTPIAWPAASLT